MQFKPPPYVLLALQMLDAGGHEAWLVGGCVRDAVLGREPQDYDIATKATPAQMRAAFSPYKTADTGIAHGTLTLVIQGHPIEVTTYRRDGMYSDGRHPDSVVFTDALLEDLKRRDFTVNAMAWHIKKGLYDPLGGLFDCEKGLLRAVGNPLVRFQEDTLRILRAFRFACGLGFDIAPGTLHAMEQKKDGLRLISAERVAQETNRALIAPFLFRGLTKYPQVFFWALPELLPISPDAQKTWNHTLQILNDTPPDLALRWAALFAQRKNTDADTGSSPAGAAALGAVMERLKQPRALREEAAALVTCFDERLTPDELPLFLSKHGIPFTEKLLHLLRAAANAHDETALIDTLIEKTEEIRQSGACLNLKSLAVGGNDLLQLGYPKDKTLGETLNRLLHMVLQGDLRNKRGDLLDQASAWLQSPTNKKEY